MTKVILVDAGNLKGAWVESLQDWFDIQVRHPRGEYTPDSARWIPIREQPAPTICGLPVKVRGCDYPKVQALAAFGIPGYEVIEL